MGRILSLSEGAKHEILEDLKKRVREQKAVRQCLTEGSVYDLESQLKMMAEMGYISFGEEENLFAMLKSRK